MIDLDTSLLVAACGRLQASLSEQEPGGLAFSAARLRSGHIEAIQREFFMRIAEAGGATPPAGEKRLTYKANCEKS
jgi:hypothetical protein